MPYILSSINSYMPFWVSKPAILTSFFLGHIIPMLQSAYSVQGTLPAQTASCLPPRHASVSFPTHVRNTYRALYRMLFCYPTWRITSTSVAVNTAISETVSIPLRNRGTISTYGARRRQYQHVTMQDIVAQLGIEL